MSFFRSKDRISCRVEEVPAPQYDVDEIEVNSVMVIKIIVKHILTPDMKSFNFRDDLQASITDSMFRLKM